MRVDFKFVMALAAILTVGLQPVDAQEEDLPSAESILMNYVEKTGGVDKYKSIKSSKAKGTMSVPAQGITGNIGIATVVPDKIAVNVEIEGSDRRCSSALTIR